MPSDPFYKSKAWYRIRQKALMRTDSTCEMCGYRGKGITVHHMKSRREFPMLELELSNLKVVCSACHNRLHDRANGTIKQNVEAIVDTDDDGFSSDEWR